MRVAVVHHWFVTRGGGERVAACIASLFPSAEIFTLLTTPQGLPRSLDGRAIHTSFLQKLPFAATHHRHMMPLYPSATESLDLRGFDLVLSSDSGPVKGVRLSPGAVHICYCHSPMRYLHDSYDSYRAQMSPLTRFLFARFAPRVRRWDVAAATRVTTFLANSDYVADRILRAYGRTSQVVHPPIELSLARLAPAGSHYLCAGRMVGYKRTDLLLAACLQLGRELRIVGAGPDEPELRHLAAAHPNAALIHFLGELPTEALWQQYAECRALLFAADEDFGMIPLEAQACGRPVICFGAGGSLETVRATGPNPTGVYFAEQTIPAVVAAILRFEAEQANFTAQHAQAWAAGFSTPIFLESIRNAVLAVLPTAASVMVEPQKVKP